MTRTRPLGVPAHPNAVCSVAPHKACPHCGFCHEHEIDMAPDDWRCEHDPAPDVCDQCGGTGKTVTGYLAGAPVYADCFCESGGFLPFEWDSLLQRENGAALTAFITKPPEYA